MVHTGATEIFHLFRYFCRFVDILRIVTDDDHGGDPAGSELAGAQSLVRLRHGLRRAAGRRDEEQLGPHRVSQVRRYPGPP